MDIPKILLRGWRDSSCKQAGPVPAVFIVFLIDRKMQLYTFPFQNVSNAFKSAFLGRESKLEEEKQQQKS